jgi:hypothetical protein
MLSKKLSLITYVQIWILDSGISSAANVFGLDCVLESVTTEGIFDASLDCL